MRIIERPAGTGPYLEAVAELLAHLPDPERLEVLEDLDEHLQEVAAELAPGGDLTARLGTPHAYAAEVVRSLGLMGAGAAGRPRALAAARRRADDLVERARATRAGREVEATWPELRPGWWVLRAWAVVGAVGIATSSVDRVLPVPAVAGSRLVGLLALAAAITVSVRVGRRQRATGTVGRRDLALSVAGVVAALALVPFFDHGGSHDVVTYVGGPGSSSGSLVTADGRAVSNIYAYGPDGQLLDQVLLYDQDGQPLVAQPPGEEGRDVQEVAPVDVNGAVVTNAFPRQLSELTWVDGRPSYVPLPPPAIAVPRLGDATATLDPWGSPVPTTAAPITTAPTLPPTTTPDATVPPTTTAPPATTPTEPPVTSPTTAPDAATTVPTSAPSPPTAA